MLDSFYVLPVLNLIIPIYLVNFETLYFLLTLGSYITYSDFLTKECLRIFSRFIRTDVRTALIPNEKVSLPKFFFLFVSLFASFYLSNCTSQNVLAFNIILFIVIIYRYSYRLSRYEIEDLTARYNLSIGYGQALCYYENYLKKCLGYKFVTRIRYFESREGIRIPHKLYILVPLSCRLIDYIDESDYIKRCKEVPSMEINDSGIPNRPYNITVYSVRYLDFHKRCALEYAQPLKALYALKDRNLLNEDELHNERKIFCESLKKMMRDSKHYHEYCELIEYDDEHEELHKVILRHVN